MKLTELCNSIKIVDPTKKNKSLPTATFWTVNFFYNQIWCTNNKMCKKLTPKPLRPLPKAQPRKEKKNGRKRGKHEF